MRPPVVESRVLRQPRHWPRSRITRTRPCGSDRYRAPCRLSVAVAGWYSIRRLFVAASQMLSPTFRLRVAHRTPCLLWRRLGKVWQSSRQRTDRYNLRFVRVTHRRKLIQERIAIQWDKRLIASARFAKRLPSTCIQSLPFHATKTKKAISFSAMAATMTSSSERSPFRSAPAWSGGPHRTRPWQEPSQ